MATEFVCGTTAGSSSRSYHAPDFRITDATFSNREEIPEHVHPGPALCIVLAGGFIDRFPSDEVECAAGSAVYYVPDQPHSTTFGPAGGRSLDITIDPEVFRNDPALRVRLETIGSSRLTVPRPDVFSIHQAIHADDDFSGRTLAEVVLGLFAQLPDTPYLRMGCRPPAWLRRVRDHLADDFVRPPGLAELAELAGVHRVQVARQFRRHYGCTTGEFVRLRRVTAAVAALREGERPLSEVAYDLGFSDQSHLTRTFRKEVGMTPGTFRKMSTTI